jgi:hypothetical protein
MATDKKFLIPVAVALSAITGSSDAIESKKTEIVDATQENVLAKMLKNELVKGDSLATYSIGAELHGLILRKNSDGVMLAEHYSHRSHSSHSSHSSHYSSR